MAIPVTALIGALNGVLNVALAIGVTVARAKSNIFLGLGDSDALLLASRRHGNNAEYLPLALVLLLAAELSGGGLTALYALGGALTVGRILHAIGVGSKPSPLRAIGAVLTWISIAGSGLYALVLSMR
jgi:uncharacterized protein